MLAVVARLVGSTLVPPGWKGREVSLRSDSVLPMHKQPLMSGGTPTAFNCLSSVSPTTCSQMHPAQARLHLHPSPSVLCSHLHLDSLCAWLLSEPRSCCQHLEFVSQKHALLNSQGQVCVEGMDSSRKKWRSRRFLVPEEGGHW